MTSENTYELKMYEIAKDFNIPTFLFGNSIKGEPPCERCKSACCRINMQIQLTKSEQEIFVHTGGVLFKKLNGECHYLKDGECSVYERRPVVCREFDCREEDFFTIDNVALHKIGKPIPVWSEKLTVEQRALVTTHMLACYMSFNEANCVIGMPVDKMMIGMIPFYLSCREKAGKMTNMMVDMLKTLSSEEREAFKNKLTSPR